MIGITYDTKRERLVLLAPFDQDNKMRLYEYDPSSKSWAIFCALPNSNCHVKGLVYSPKDDAYYALARLFESKDEGRHTYIYKILPDGLVGQATQLSRNLCGSEQWFKADLSLALHNEYIAVTMLGQNQDPVPPRVYLCRRDNGRFKYMSALGY